MNTKHLKAKILDLAIRGKLVPQNSSEGNASDLLKKIREEKGGESLPLAPECKHSSATPCALSNAARNACSKKSTFIIKDSDGRHYEHFADGSQKDIEDEIPFEIPENWCWCRLGSLLSIKSGDLLKVGENQTGEYPIYGGNGINGYYSKYNVEANTIIIGRVGFYCGSIHVTKNKAWVTDNAFITNFNSKLIQIDYLTYLLKKLDLRTKSNSTAQPVVSGRGIYPIPIPLPPLAEQQRIVCAIEKTFEQIDIIEKNKLKLKTYIKQTKSKVLDLAIHGKLVPQNSSEGNAFELLKKIRTEKTELIKQKKLKEDKATSFIIKDSDGRHYEHFANGSQKDIEDEIPFELPENWCWCRLPELCSKISDGTHKTPTYVDTGVPFLSVQNISKGYFDLSIIKYITKEEHNKLCQRIKPQKDDILICRIGTLGRAIKNTLDFEFSIFVSLGVIRLMDTKMVDYIISTINSNYGTNWIDDNKVQGSHTNKINLETFPKLLIPLPPFAEQQRIVTKIEQIFAQLNALEKSLGE